MVQNIITDLCHHLEIGIDGNLDIGNKRVIVGTPTITLIGNTFTITCSTSNANIYYTLDGSTPTANSIRYTSAVTLSNNCTIKAIAIKGNKYSAIVEETYVKPITYLTQWKIVGNSEVHTDPFLTSWKVSGNSVVDNNTILSCGDLEQDGKYHVKISNGVNVYDIPLTAPLRKVDDVADSIEFPSDTEGKALVKRVLKEVNITSSTSTMVQIGKTGFYRIIFNEFPNREFGNLGFMAEYTRTKNPYTGQDKGMGLSSTSTGLSLYDERFNQADSRDAFREYLKDAKLIYKLATPTTELVDAPQIAVSPTDTYTSANATPYSAFEHTKHSEIWSCGEYNATDGKYHILVQPLGGSIADIALDEPLRKTGNTADTLEYPTETSGKALLTTRVEESGGELSPLDTPTTELVDAPQITEADSYFMVISQGAKAVSWSSFETD